MFKLSKMCDHALVLCSHLAKNQNEEKSSGDWALLSGVPIATTAKLLKMMVKKGYILSSRGSQGGYKLAKSAKEISVLNIVEAIDGSIAILDCCSHGSGCDLSKKCSVSNPLNKIETEIVKAFAEMKLSDLVGHHE